jgi:hypothetical protein
MNYLLFFQHVWEIVIIILILAAPFYSSRKQAFLVALAASIIWITFRMVDIEMFHSPMPPLIFYVVMPGLVFIWMMAVRLIWRLIRWVIKR